GWDYMTQSENVVNGHLHDDTLDKKLTSLGNQGWELTHVTPLTLDGKTTCLVHHFRRLAERTRSAGFQS
ncbi:MAG: hypothetical protein L3K26_14795, partial [Candidatus Hydrogenedentes bacterium]|nr:hypothetical protein [Candidatus Hydrogenedentota bacterium]